MRYPLVAIAALLLLLLAGCAGVGEEGGDTSVAAGRPPAQNEARLVVSRDLGATVFKDVTVPLGEGTTVMRLLAENAKVETQYGGGFVKSIDGLTSTYKAVANAEAQDWFYWVDGVMADVGAGDYPLRGGETVWWDYHAWARAMFLPTAIYAFPSPWSSSRVTLTTDLSNTVAVEQWATQNGITLNERREIGSSPSGEGIVVVTAASARKTAWLRSLLAGKGSVRLVDLADNGLTLRALDGTPGPSASGVCLALPNSTKPESPLLVLLVGGEADLQTLLDVVKPASASARLAFALVDGKVVLLPWSAT